MVLVVRPDLPVSRASTGALAQADGLARACPLCEDWLGRRADLYARPFRVAGTAPVPTPVLLRGTDKLAGLSP
jgi:hypothetical protein